jgi:hypothetical protein
MSDSSFFSRSNLDNSGVTSARNTVDVLHVSLRDNHLVVVHDLGDIVMGSALDNVFNLESLDAFVFRNSSTAVGADNNTRVSSILLVSSIISSFLGHL